MRCLGLAAAAAATMLVTSAPPVAAETVEEFYKGRTVTMYVGSRPGGTYALYARLLGNHLPKHIPGHPKITYKFDDATGGLIASNYLSNAAPRDGSYIGSTQQSVPVSQVINPGVGRFDVRKWILLGSMTPARNLFALWRETTPAKTIEEAKKAEVKLGATGKTSPTYIHPTLMNKFLGTRFKVITGFKFGAAHLAMEQGQVHGINSSWTSFKVRYPQYVKNNKLVYLVQIGRSKEPDLQNVPLLRDFIKDPKHRAVMDLVSISNEFGRFFFLPPGVPKDRADALRKAFAAMLEDPELLAEAKKRKLPIEAVSYQTLEKLLAELHSAPADVVAIAREAMAIKR